MFWSILSLFLAVVAWIAYTRRPTWPTWKSTYLPRVIFLFGVGITAASPFLAGRALGTSEAYNYSLAVADFVTQERAGVFPPLVGQTEFAFNGRIHPLRTAPWLLHLTGALDCITFRRLNFWELQNLALTLSILATVGACYYGLRRATSISPRLALILTAAFTFSPGLLSAAYGMDLYMTVAAAPCVPLVICANLRCWETRSFRLYMLLAAALALAWWAHPPVAFWLSVVTFLLQGTLLASGRVKLHHLPAIGAAVGFGGLLASFAFESALSVKTLGDIANAKDVKLLHREVSRVFLDSLRPISATADRLGDFQLGYVFWALALFAAIAGVWRRQPTIILLTAISAFFLTLTTPVPWLHVWLWDHLPAISVTLTNQWPMQRLYLIVTALAIFAFALAWRPLPSRNRFVTDLLRLVLLTACAWTAHQAYRFIDRGLMSRSPTKETVAGHLPENINPTVISYAILGAPGSFVNGTMDPAFEFRLLRPVSATELTSNWQAPIGAVKAQGEFKPVDSGNKDIVLLAPAFTLEPGHRYKLAFEFTAPPLTATLQLRGKSFFREYALPAAGNARGFGQLPGNNPALTLWTTSNTAEEIELSLVAPGLGASPPPAFAKFSFSEINPNLLPIQLDRLVPTLRATVHAPAECFLETPRLFVDGYVATVDGQPVRVQRSLEGLAMLQIPAGEHQVDLAYAGSRKLRALFWLSLSSWLGFLGWIAASSIVQRRPESALARPLVHAHAILVQHSLTLRLAAGEWIKPRRFKLGLAALILLAGLFTTRQWLARRQACGPLLIRVELPRGETNRSQPILVTGKPHAGTFIYVIYVDDHHVKLGVDVWGQLGYESPSIPIDYFGDQEILVSTGSLYPEGNHRLAKLEPAQLDNLRRRILVTLNGQVAIDQMLKNPDYPATLSEITVGENRIGGSHTEPRFVGKILRVERLWPTADPH